MQYFGSTVVSTARVFLHPRPLRVCAKPRRASARRGEVQLVCIHRKYTELYLVQYTRYIPGTRYTHACGVRVVLLEHDRGLMAWSSRHFAISVLNLNHVTFDDFLHLF